MTWPGAPTGCEDGGDRDCDGEEDRALGDVHFVAAGGEVTDLSERFVGEGQTRLMLARDGALRFCEGRWDVNLVLEADVRVIGVGGATRTILDGNGSDPVIEVEGERAVDLRGLTITGGEDSCGGGLRAWDSSITIEDSIFDSNRGFEGAGYYDSVDYGAGGAVCLYDSTLEVRDTTFVDNYVVWDGGAIYLDRTDATVSDCRFEGNEAGNGGGGAIYLDEGHLEVTRSGFFDNEAIDGGGLYLADHSSANNWEETGPHEESTARLTMTLFEGNAPDDGDAKRTYTLGEVIGEVECGDSGCE